MGGEDYEGITDRHTVIPAAFAATALSMLHDIVTTTGLNSKFCGPVCATSVRKGLIKKANPEHFLHTFYSTKRLPVVRFPRTMYSVRDPKETQATSWRPGEVVPELGPDVLVKYMDEFTDARDTAG